MAVRGRRGANADSVIGQPDMHGIGVCGRMDGHRLDPHFMSPPGDGLRVAQDHFIEYVKPVLSASGLDWEFVQGRQQGDVRAAVAEKIRRSRMADERPSEELAKTEDSMVTDLRKKMGIPDYEGVKGDIVIGRHRSEGHTS